MTKIAEVFQSKQKSLGKCSGLGVDGVVAWLDEKVVAGLGGVRVRVRRREGGRPAI
jgi:hypothetical protein